MKRIGIIGGMGPMASVDLMKKIILATDAATDQEHIPMLLDNNTQVPDRTKAILGLGPSPVPEMLASAKRLEAGGADFIIMACNTAHYFLPEILPKLNIPVVSIITTTVDSVKKRGFKKIGLLCTSGTARTGLYQKALEENGMECISPVGEEQKLVDAMIYDGVKANNLNYDIKPVENLLAKMQSQGAEAFILGCTEVPLAVEMYHLKGVFIDATDELALAAVKLAKAD